MKVLTVGTGLICETMIEAFNKVDIEVFASVGRDLERLRSFCLKNGVRHYSDNYDEALRSDNFDTVYIALPNSLHFEYAKKALLNNKNVIVEKPFAHRFDKARELIELANEKGLFIFDATMTVHNLAFRHLKDDLTKIGQIKMVTLDFSKYSSRYDRFLNGECPNVFDPAYCGGALNDLGIYNLSFATGIFGLPKSLKYFANVQRGIDTSGTFVLDYGVFKVIGISCKDSVISSLINIVGEKGRIYSSCNPSVLDSYYLCLNDEKPIFNDFKSESPYVYELRVFKRIYEQKDFSLMNKYLTLTLMNIKLLDELRKSADLGY